MKLPSILAICILLVSCEKNDAAYDVGKSDITLTFVKALFNGEEIVQSEFQYFADGKIKTALGYKDYSKNLVGYKRTYNYEGDRLVNSEIQMDISSSLFAVNYIYSKAQYEYNGNLIIQSNHFSKKNDEYEMTSFVTYTYNDRKLPVKISRYAAGGSLYGYSTYSYDENGNVVLLEDYGINDLGEPVKTMQNAYTYDNKNNPYQLAYHPLENIPYSVNKNNILTSSWVNYVAGAQPPSGTSTTVYNSYNTYGYPTSMNEQGNVFLLEYK
ncbi:MAG: hypothetical protein IT249_20100 [Chitinophagaceae bacterium]|nr:hypothetical protein [Chitinophagaceae bacterium]